MARVTIVDTIWTGSTGRELRRHGPEVREVQFYLVCGPDSDVYGLFPFEVSAIAMRTGRSETKVLNAMKVLAELEFCRFDEPTGWIWVLEMAQHQFNLPLKAVDYRCASARKWYSQLTRNPYIADWYDRYVEDFDLRDRANNGRNAVERRPWRPVRETLEPPRDGKGHPQGQPEGEAQPLISTGSPTLFAPEGVIGGSGGKEGEPSDKPLKGAAFDAAFEELWPIYPNGKEKANAKTELAKLKPTRAFFAQLRASIVEHGSSAEWTKEGGRYIPRLVNFLKKRGWEDRLEPARPVLTERNERNRQAGESFLSRRRQGETAWTPGNRSRID